MIVGMAVSFRWDIKVPLPVLCGSMVKNIWALYIEILKTYDL